MKNLFIVILTVIVVIVGALLLFGTRDNNSTSTNNSQITPTQTSTADPFINGNPDTTSLEENGNRYTDPNGVYTFLYPNDYNLDSQNNDQYIRIFKQGPTQQGQTEMYDGVIIVFESLDLQGTSLSEFVDARIQESTADGTSEVVQPKKATTLNNYPGFTYEIRGLGTSTYLVLQKDSQSNNGVSITFLVADPEQVGFQQEVNAILSTLELQK